jgi:hypothetical protein
MRSVAGRPMLSWQDTPFFLTASPGSRQRTEQRVQAHKNRIHVLKAHHTQTSSHKQLAKIEKEINKLEHHLLRDQRRLFGTPRTLLDRQVYGPRAGRR